MKTIQTFFFILAFPLLVNGQSYDTTCTCENWSNISKDNVVVEGMASYPGGYIELGTFLNASIKFKSSLNTKVKVSFVISCKGDVCGFVIDNTSRKISEKAAAKIVEQLKLMKTWNPAKQMGRTVDVPFSITITIVDGYMEISGPILYH